MTTAVDTNVLLDLLIPGAPHGDESEQHLGTAARRGAVIISAIVYAELAAYFDNQADLDAFVEQTGLGVVSASREALHLAGSSWRQYSRRRPRALVCSDCGAAQPPPSCERCGTSVSIRQHVLADFLIGAHASAHADRLLTRDRGYYSTYFPDLTLA